MPASPCTEKEARPITQCTALDKRALQHHFTSPWRFHGSERAGLVLVKGGRRWIRFLRTNPAESIQRAIQSKHKIVPRGRKRPNMSISRAQIKINTQELPREIRMIIGSPARRGRGGFIFSFYLKFELCWEQTSFMLCNPECLAPVKAPSRGFTGYPCCSADELGLLPH